MYKYRIYGLIFDTDLELPECEKVETSISADVLVRYNCLQDMIDEIGAQEEKNRKRLGSECEMPSTYSKTDGDVYYSYIVGVVYFKISGGNLIEYRAANSVDDILFRQWMLCYAMTLVLIKRREIVLHCAGLLVPGTDDAFLVCGDSGAGKSTTSNALLDSGFQFISDDSVRVSVEEGVPKVFGSCMQRRLCEDVVERGLYNKEELNFFEEGEKKKWVVNMGSQYFGGKPHVLKKLFFLTFSDKDCVDIKEVLGPEKITRIMRALYKTGAYRKEGLTVDLFTRFAAIAQNIKVYIIERPVNKMTVDSITSLIIDKMR